VVAKAESGASATMVAAKNPAYTGNRALSASAPFPARPSLPDVGAEEIRVRESLIKFVSVCFEQGTASAVPFGSAKQPALAAEGRAFNPSLLARRRLNQSFLRMPGGEPYACHHRR
jgi:hypothetical protein